MSDHYDRYNGMEKLLGTNLAEVGTDLISRQAAIDYFVLNVGFHDEDGYPIEDTDELRKIWIEYFDGIPSIQPEIVRCEECKYHYQRNCPIEKYFSLDGFCSRGER